MQSKSLETKYDDEELRSKVNEFLTNVELNNYQKEDIDEYYQSVARHASDIRMIIFRINKALDNWDEHPESVIVRRVSSQYKTKDEATKAIEENEIKLNEWMQLCEKLEKLRNINKNFNKSICFSNIRELINDNPDVKIGQIEKEAGIRLGYMARLEKGDNPAEPSIEFVVTAAKLLNVSVDTLINRDLASLTANEKYIVRFIEKMKSDTLANKLKWNVETEFELGRDNVDINGESTHPLFSVETFFRKTEVDYPEQVTDNVYVSKTFGPNTCITGDCYNLRLKNGSTFYLMNLEKDVHYTKDNTAFVKEAVMYVPYGKKQVLATTQDESPIGDLVEELYSIVTDNMKHPPVNNQAKYAIDAFMNDDLTDDPEELPF